MSDLDNFIEELLKEPSVRWIPLFEAYYLVEILSKPGRHRASKVNPLPVHESSNGVQMLKVHKDFELIITLPLTAPADVSLNVGVRLTFPVTDKAGVPLRPSASVSNPVYNAENKTFSFVLRPAHSPHGKGPRPANDRNAFTLVLTLLSGEGEVLNVSELGFGAFANPNSREKAKRGLSVVPCFLNNGLATLTESSKDAFLRGAIFPGSLPAAYYLPDVEQHQVPSPSTSSAASLEVDSFFSSQPLSPFSFVSSPTYEILSPFPDQYD